jgi:type II secretory pathway pseudopilin PulG
MKRTRARAFSRTNGYAMAALLVGMTIMAVFLTVALPAWSTAVKREKEAELIFRGQQYARAIALFQRKYANTFPPNIDILLNEHFLRKKYKDPMTKDGEFQVLYANQQAAAQPNAGQPNAGLNQLAARQGGGTVPQRGQPARPVTQVASGGPGGGQQGGIVGVASKSTATSLRVYDGHDKYNEWVFVATQVTNRVNAPNATRDPTGGVNLPGGVGGAGGRGGRGGAQLPPGTRGNQPGGRGNPNQPGPFGRPGGGGFGAPPIGAPFGGPPFGGPPGRGR